MYNNENLNHSANVTKDNGEAPIYIDKLRQFSQNRSLQRPRNSRLTLRLNHGNQYHQSYENSRRLSHNVYQNQSSFNSTQNRIKKKIKIKRQGNNQSASCTSPENLLHLKLAGEDSISSMHFNLKNEKQPINIHVNYGTQIT